MEKYCNCTSIMVTAYSKLTGQTIEQTLQALGCADTINPEEIQIKSKEEEVVVEDLLKDPVGVLRWVKGR